MQRPVPAVRPRTAAPGRRTQRQPASLTLRDDPGRDTTKSVSSNSSSCAGSAGDSPRSGLLWLQWPTESRPSPCPMPLPGPKWARMPSHHLRTRPSRKGPWTAACAACAACVHGTRTGEPMHAHACRNCQSRPSLLTRTLHRCSPLARARCTGRLYQGRWAAPLPDWPHQNPPKLATPVRPVSWRGARVACFML